MANDTAKAPEKMTADMVKKEIKALEALTGALAELPKEAQTRIIRYATNLYGIHLGTES